MNYDNRTYIVLRAMLIVVAIFNFSSLVITSFMIENACTMTDGAICVYEANLIPAQIFAIHGYLMMYAMLCVFWFGIFLFISLIRKRNLSFAIKLSDMLVATSALLVGIDFSNNLYILFVVIFN